jgi:hypothetical protein
VRVVWIGLGGDRKKWTVPLNMAGHSDSVTNREFVDWWSNHQPLQKKRPPLCLLMVI